MKASELINELTNFVEKHGDRTLICFVDGDTYNLSGADCEWANEDPKDKELPFEITLDV